MQYDGADQSTEQGTLFHPSLSLDVSHAEDRETPCFAGFAWAVPLAFAPAVATCRFERGDILYDTVKAYKSVWRDAQPHISYSIQVKWPPRSVAAVVQDSPAGETAFRTNWGSGVEVMLEDHKQASSRRITTTQGRLYTALRTGDITWLGDSCSAPLTPMLASQLSLHLKRLKSIPKSHQQPAQTDDDAKSITRKPNVVFLMAYDEAQFFLRDKVLRVGAALRELNPQFTLLHPSLLYTPVPMYAPTVGIACFLIASSDPLAVVETLKPWLYKPANNDLDNFNIGLHGYLGLATTDCLLCLGERRDDLYPPTK